MAYCSTTEVRRRMFMGAGAGGSATTAALPEEELRDLIEQASRMFDLVCGVEPGYFEPAYYPIWESSHAYAVGDIVTPTTRNSHIYRVTTAGTSGTTEPSFPTGSGLTVVSGNVTFTEAGSDVVATSRTFYGDGSNYIFLDPYVPGTLNTTLTMPSGYVAPSFVEQNGFLVLTTSTGVLPPFSNFLNSYWPGWYVGVGVTVLAVWGFPATPADVKLAVIELVINLERETDPASVKLKNLEGQALRESLPPRVREISKRYRPKVGVAFV